MQCKESKSHVDATSPVLCPPCWSQEHPRLFRVAPTARPNALPVPPFLIFAFWHNTVMSGRWIDGSVWSREWMRTKTEDRGGGWMEQFMRREWWRWNKWMWCRWWMEEVSKSWAERWRQQKRCALQGTSGRRSEVAMLQRDSYPKPCWPLTLNAGTTLYCPRQLCS